MKNKILSVFILALISLVLISFVKAQDERGKIAIQGRLTDASGNPLTGTYTFNFSIYNSSTSGQLLWSQVKQVSVNKGIFSTEIGPIPLPFDVPYYLEVRINNEVLQPRYNLTAAPYSFISLYGGIGSGIGGSISSSQIAFGTGTNIIGGDNSLTWDNINKRLGIGTSNPSAKLDVNGSVVISGKVGIGTMTPSSYVGLDVRNSEPLGNRGQIIVDTYLLRNTPNEAYVPNDAAAHIDVYRDNMYIVLHNWGGTTGRGLYLATKQGESKMGLIHGGNVEIYSGNLSVLNGGAYFNGSIGIGTTAPTYKLDVAGDARITGNLTVGGYLQIGGVKLTYVTGTNPSCPSGYQILSKRYYGTCGGDGYCPGCEVNSWDTNPVSCQWLGWHPGVGCSTPLYCTVSTWNAALCIGS